MLQTRLTQEQIRTLLAESVTTLELFEQAKEQQLRQYYEEHKQFRKGDRKGWFGGVHEADQTYEQYNQVELERFCRSGSLIFKDSDSVFYRMKHNLYDWQIETLEELQKELDAAVRLELESVMVEVNKLAVIKSKPRK